MATTPAIKLLTRSLNAKPIATLTAPAITRKFCSVMLKMMGIIVSTATVSSVKRIKGTAARNYNLNLLGPCFANTGNSLRVSKINNHTEPIINKICVKLISPRSLISFDALIFSVLKSGILGSLNRVRRTPSSCQNWSVTSR